MAIILLDCKFKIILYKNIQFIYRKVYRKVLYKKKSHLSLTQNENHIY